MKIKNISLLSILLSLFFATTVHAKPNNYTFDVQAAGVSIIKTSGGLATTLLNASFFPGKDFSKATVKFQPNGGGTGTLLLTFKDKFIQYGVTNGAVDYTKVLGTGINGEFTITIVNATRITKPNGIIGYTGNAASSTGKARFTNVVDVTGDNKSDTIEFGFEAKYMNFYANLASTNYLSEIANLGNCNFYLWDSVKLAGLVAKTWFGSVGAIKVNGTASSLFSMTTGDLHFNHGVTGKYDKEEDCDEDDYSDDDSDDEDYSEEDEDDDSDEKYNGRWRKNR